MVYIERIVYKTHSGGIRISMVWRLLGGETSLPLFLLVFVLFFLQAPPGHFVFCTKLGWDVLLKISFEVCAHIYISSYTVLTSRPWMSQPLQSLLHPHFHHKACNPSKSCFSWKLNQMKSSHEIAQFGWLLFSTNLLLSRLTSRGIESRSKW